MRLMTARACDRAVLLAGTVAVAGRQYDVPSRDFWHAIVGDLPYLPIVLIALVGVFGALTPFEFFTRRLHVERQVAVQRQVLTAFGQLLDIASAVRPPLPSSDPGLHIWRQRRTFRHPGGELVRVATYRLGSFPATRPLRPLKGVGVVGICWLLDHEVGYDIEDLAGRLTDRATFESYRRQQGEEAVMGLCWEQFERFRHRGAVFASPIRNARANFIGCVSFDLARGYGQLDQSRLWHELNSLCALLGNDGFENL